MDSNTRSLKPPKEWAEHMISVIKEGNPEYDDAKAQATMGEIWYHRLSKNKQKGLRHKEGKEYGTAKSIFENVSFGGIFGSKETKEPATVGEGWTDPEVTTVLDAYEHALRQRKITPEDAFALVTGTSKTSRNTDGMSFPGMSTWWLRRRGERMEDFCIGAALRGLPMPDVEFADDRQWTISDYSDVVVGAFLKAAQQILKKIDVESLEERVGADLDGDEEKGEDKEHREAVLGHE